MKTSFKNCLRPNFRLLPPKNLGLENLGGGIHSPPHRPSDPYAPLNETKKDKLFFKNRPFYRYGGHIELIRFTEYYRMWRGHEHISFVFTSVFQGIFSQSFVRIRL